MIVGNPYKFAIVREEIKEWNIDNTFSNGVLLFFIDGAIFPKEIITVSLNCELRPLKDKLKQLCTNQELFDVPKEVAFRKLYNITYPKNIEIGNDYCFDITPPSFLDNNCCIFGFNNGSQVKILAAKLNYKRSTGRHELDKITVIEAVLPVEELNEIVRQL